MAERVGFEPTVGIACGVQGGRLAVRTGRSTPGDSRIRRGLFPVSPLLAGGTGSSAIGAFEWLPDLRPACAPTPGRRSLRRAADLLRARGCGGFNDRL